MNADAQWLRDRAEDLVGYEEDAQRLRRIAASYERLYATLQSVQRQAGRLSYQQWQGVEAAIAEAGGGQ